MNQGSLFVTVKIIDRTGNTMMRDRKPTIVAGMERFRRLLKRNTTPTALAE
ncbi:MAG: hypothetical protein NTZ04_04130 [Chloroflexi bacterium]|nr:hypothetical protein [Chloroflexota bacterium]